MSNGLARYSTAQETIDSSEKSRAKLLHKMQAAAENAETLSADFVYIVSSAKQQQLVTGTVQLMKPIYARLKFSYMAKPAFPCLVASDGKQVYTFTPQSFTRDRKFAPGPFDSILGAKQASGIVAGGGTISSDKARKDAGDLVLWDAAPIQAFFNPKNALRRNLYVRDESSLEVEDPVQIDGITYDVIYHFFEPGNIAGGENSSFHQRLYVAPDGLIHQYVLEFESAGAGGTQVARLTNVRLNEPMSPKDFEFELPEETTEPDSAESE